MGTYLLIYLSSTFSKEKQSEKNNKHSMSSLTWQRVCLYNPSTEVISQIIKTKFPIMVVTKGEWNMPVKHKSKQTNKISGKLKTRKTQIQHKVSWSLGFHSESQENTSIPAAWSVFPWYLLCQVNQLSFSGRPPRFKRIFFKG